MCGNVWKLLFVRERFFYGHSGIEMQRLSAATAALEEMSS